MKPGACIGLDTSVRVRFGNGDLAAVNWQKILAAVPSGFRLSEAVLFLERQPGGKDKPDIKRAASRRLQGWEQDLTTRCRVQLRELERISIVCGNEKHTAGQLVVAAPTGKRLIAVNVSYNIYPLVHTVVLRCTKVTEAELASLGPCALRVGADELYPVYEAFGEQWGSEKIGETDSKDFNGYARILNKDLAAAGLPSLLRGTSKHGFWPDTLPSLVSFLPAPPL